MRWTLLEFTCVVAQRQAHDPCEVDLALSTDSIPAQAMRFRLANDNYLVLE
jgi:hypothetical protein